MKSIQVGNTVLDISKFEAGDGKGTHIDSGTTLAYLPGPIFDPVRQLILTSQPNLSIQLVEDFYECFHFNKSIDESFPTVTFGFENSLELNVYPHDYLLPVVSKNLVLANKLVLYDLENQVLGLSTVSSSTVGLKDEASGTVIQVGSHDLSSSPARSHIDISSSPARYHMDFGRAINLFLPSFMLYNYLFVKIE
ncbi:hypothetical protein C5167_040275 [Papaver somniferum]|uniref:Peptidase A1 domain-containing protein n=1 Tax=Papaver somniferum TaxID=3469 RepID=A0A4Y7IGX6_PAPSO|nr:hypothetical protein C5167_040275 [Papaver somniferum]